MKQTTNRTVIVLIMMMLTTMTAWADTETVSYIDADGNAQTVTATVLTGNEEPSRWGTIDLAAGWYVVKGNISYTNQIGYGSSTGTIHIILADGAQMAVEYNGSAAISLSNYFPLAIYGQSAGTGRLSVTSDRNTINARGGITINGGIVSATSTEYGNCAINADYKAITINGGQVTATPGDNAMGIVTEGTITLGLRSTSDFITANGYYGTVNIKDGQTLYAGATAYSGNNVSLPSGTVTLRPYSSDDFSVNDAGTEYTIHTATGWNVFCDCLNDNDTYNRFSGKTVRLGDDITVTRMAGSDHHDFCGTFDGGGNTLTVTLSGSSDRMAPFSYISNVDSDPAAIRNLNVVADITSSGQNASALVGEAWGELTIEQCTVSGTVAVSKQFAGGIIGSASNTPLNISNCISSVTIQSSVSGDGTHGGFAGRVPSSATLNISGCVFDGKIITTSGTTNCGGFVGHSEHAEGSNVSITNCLYAPTADDQTISEGCETFCRNIADGHITNCYYTRALGTAQGKATRTVAAATDVTIDAVALTGTATQYTVSGITAYSGGGLQRGQTLYYGSGDQLSLTLSNSATPAPRGYQYAYTASAGTLSGSTLTMPDEDVTISVNTADLAPIDWATVNQGNSADPYMIYNKDQLLLLAHRVNGTNGETANTYEGKYFKLGADITFTHAADEGDDYAENYEAIGGYYNSTYRHFKGKFDGDGRTVSGIRINKTGSDVADIYQGLFGCISSGADIYDVHLTDARIKGCESVGGIAGYNTEGYIMRCSVTDSYITATGNYNYGTICGRNNYPNRLRNNYYHGCTVNGTAVTSGKGCMEADITDYNGALPAYRLDLGANITTPPGTFAGQTEWLDTPPVSPRLAPENGFTLAGNHYFASGYEFTPGSTLASGAAQGYTPRATLGDQLLDPYTPTGDADPLAGKAIAQFTVTADCDGKTLASTEAIYSTGQPVTVAYIKADGTPGEAIAIALDGTETSLAAGWYFVGKDISYSHTVNLTGNVTLILADGKTMNIGTSGGRIEETGIEPDGNFEIDELPTLTITSESLGEDMGHLSVYTTGNGRACITTGTIDINGGNITADTDGRAAFPIYAFWDLTINGGTVTATTAGTDAHAIKAGNFNYNGGNVTATATGDGATGIYATANDGTALTLGWTRPDDRITASSISTGEGGTVAVADGQALTDGSGHIYTGTLTASELSAFAAETTLQPCLALADAASNTAAITDHAGQTLAVALSGRTLYKDGSWNTLCLPFDVTDGNTEDEISFTGTPLEGADVMTLNSNDSGLSGTTLTLNFSDAPATIPAGTPFIVKWGDKDEPSTLEGLTDLTAPVFTGVTVSNANNDVAFTGGAFKGTYASITYEEENKSILFVGAQNNLYWPTVGFSIGAQRAYFELNGEQQARNIVLNFFDEQSGKAEREGEEKPLSISPVGERTEAFPREGLDGVWYTLDGRKLSGTPTQKGVYVHNGFKTVIK